MTVRMRYTPTLAPAAGDEWTIEQVTTHDPDPVDSIYGTARESRSTVTGPLPWLREIVAGTVASAEADGDESGARVWNALLDEIDGLLAVAASR